MTKRFNLIALLLGVGIATVILDQLSKQWALTALADGHEVKLIGEFLSFKLIFNPGAAFGLGTGATWIFTLVSAAVVIGVPFFFSAIKQRSLAIIVGLIWGGALGNLIDRLVREPGFPKGHVVDFIKYGDWFIGNIADIALVLGLAIVLILEFFRKETPKVKDEVESVLSGEPTSDSVAASDAAALEVAEESPTAPQTGAETAIRASEPR